MQEKIDTEDVKIRNDFIAGDLGYVIHMHGRLYGIEYGYGVQFEMYVAEGIREFFDRYDPNKDRIWLCEHNGKIVGSLFLMHRENDAAQLRYFLLEPEFRGLGLGSKLMQLYMEFLKQSGYRSSFLWTTQDLAAAAKLYTKHGFRLTEEKESTAFGKPLREQRYDLIMDDPSI